MNDAAKAIKKHAAQHDLFNRLHSIAADERFVQKVAQEWFSNRFEVIGESRGRLNNSRADTSLQRTSGVELGTVIPLYVYETCYPLVLELIVADQLQSLCLLQVHGRPHSREA